MRKQLFTGVLGCLALCAQAQRKVEAVYAAPGMPVHLQRGLPKEVPRNKKPFLTESMPRFWLETDSALQLKGMNQVLNAVLSRITFPKAAMIEGVKGQILVRAILSPEGVPMMPEVVRRSSTFEAVDKKVVDLLDAETIRVVQLLRFKPKPGTPDTLTVPMSYFFQ
jgi:outer membrane biosynthesis protein TonB